MGSCTTYCDTKIECYKKRSKTIRVTVQVSTSVPLDLTGALIWFSVKRDNDDADTDSLISKKNLDNGGSDAEAQVVDGPNGILEVYIDPTDTEAMEAGDYKWDVVIETAAGRRKQAVNPSRFSIFQPTTLT